MAFDPCDKLLISPRVLTWEINWNTSYSNIIGDQFVLVVLDVTHQDFCKYEISFDIVAPFDYKFNSIQQRPFDFCIWNQPLILIMDYFLAIKYLSLSMSNQIDEVFHLKYSFYSLNILIFYSILQGWSKRQPQFTDNISESLACLPPVP